MNRFTAPLISNVPFQCSCFDLSIWGYLLFLLKAILSVFTIWFSYWITVNWIYDFYISTDVHNIITHCNEYACHAVHFIQCIYKNQICLKLRQINIMTFTTRFFLSLKHNSRYDVRAYVIVYEHLLCCAHLHHYMQILQSWDYICNCNRMKSKCLSCLYLSIIDLIQRRRWEWMNELNDFGDSVATSFSIRASVLSNMCIYVAYLRFTFVVHIASLCGTYNILLAVR